MSFYIKHLMNTADRALLEFSLFKKDQKIKKFIHTYYPLIESSKPLKQKHVQQMMEKGILQSFWQERTVAESYFNQSFSRSGPLMGFTQALWSKIYHQQNSLDLYPLVYPVIKQEPDILLTPFF